MRSLRIFLLAACLVLLHVSLGVAQVSDVKPPQLIDLSVQPISVDVSSSNQTITVTLAVTDDLSGIASVGVRLGLPSGFFNGACPPINANRTSGDNLNATYSSTITVPRNGAAGQWPLSITLTDAAGNTSTISALTLANRGLPSKVSVVSATPDTTPAQVTGISFVPSPVDASNSDVQASVQIAAMDTGTGVSFNPACFSTQSITINGPNAQQIRLFRASFTRISGTAQSGVWESQFSIPQYSSGSWTAASLVLDDAAGNSITYSTAGLRAIGIEPTFNVVSATPDLEAPTLTLFDMVPAVVNTSVGQQSVVFTFGLKDNLSGVSFAPSTFFNRVFFTSPSGSQTNRILQTDEVLPILRTEKLTC